MWCNHGYILNHSYLNDIFLPSRVVWKLYDGSGWKHRKMKSYFCSLDNCRAFGKQINPISYGFVSSADVSQAGHFRALRTSWSSLLDGIRAGVFLNITTHIKNYWWFRITRSCIRIIQNSATKVFNSISWLANIIGKNISTTAIWGSAIIFRICWPIDIYYRKSK